MRLVEIIKTGYCRRKYIVDTGETPTRLVEFASLDVLGEYSGVPSSTLYSRLKRCGDDYSKVLDESSFSINKKTEKEETEVLPEWDRGRCRRGLDQCKHYCACQNSRLGLFDSPAWIAPENTDECYEMPIMQFQHNGSLNGHVGFVR